MQNTTYAVGFTDDTTIQLRFELGRVEDGIQSGETPEGVLLDSEGYAFDNGFIGRQTGLEGEFFQPFDRYLASDIDPLFDPVEALDDETLAAGIERSAPADDLSRWSVMVDGAPVQVVGVSRKANILQTAETSLFEFDFRTAQHVFLELDTPLAQGQNVEIRFDDATFQAVEAVFDPAKTLSEAIHVNLVGYDPDDLSKTAFLSSWNGWDPNDGGQSITQDYRAGLTFDVVEAATGAVVKTGEVTPGLTQAQTGNFALTDVWEMDFSDITAEGEYFVRVDGVGISQTFTIADTHWQDIFDVSFSGFYHQRSGIALEDPYTEFVRPASLVPGETLAVHRTTLKITETSEGGGADKPFDRLVAQDTGEVVNAFGGWHDAGDWDRRTQHLEAARNLIELGEITGEWGARDDRAIPEQGDGIPDLLQEAIWGIEVFKRLQTEDGGIPGGIEQDSYADFGEASWSEGPVIYAYAPDVWSSWEYAAAAAKVAHNLAPFDAVAAADWLVSAQAAWDYAEATWQVELGGELSAVNATSRNIAALELYRETGEAEYHDVFEATSVYAAGDLSDVQWFEHQYEAAFLYNRLGDQVLNDTIRATGFQDIEAEVASLLADDAAAPFGTLYDPWAPYGWGNTATQPNYAQDSVVRLYHLTGDAALLRAIQADVQYALGANPLNMAYLTGLDGVRGPEEILNLDAETLGYGPVPGITVYGDFQVFDYGEGFYHDVMRDEQWPGVFDAPVHESWQGYSLYVPVTEYTVQQGIADMTYVTGYLAALDPVPETDTDPEPHQETGPEPEPVPVINVVVGTDLDDTLRGTEGRDLMIGHDGDDRLFGSDGADEMYGGANSDILDGGNGDDLLVGGDGVDLLFGGMGDDKLRGGEGRDTLRGEQGDDDLTGGKGVDWLVGGYGDDILDGGSDGDFLLGQRGDDQLSGGDGDDRLLGGVGNDVMTGGAGRDAFVFRSDWGQDRISDFSAEADQLILMIDGLSGLQTAEELVAQFGASSEDGLSIILDFGNDDMLWLQSKSILNPAELMIEFDIR